MSIKEMNNIIIPSIKRESLDCYQNNIVASLCDYFAIDYRPTFWTNFYFGFKKSEKLVLNDINIFGNDGVREQKILEDVCGIKCNIMEDLTIEEFTQIIQEEIMASIPVGVNIDSYHLVWNKHYHQVYRYHFILITGIDIKTGLLYCCDGYLSNTIQSITIEEIYINHNYVITFKCTATNMDFHSYFRNVINESFNNKFSNMLLFSMHITECKYDPMMANFNDDIETSSFIFKFTRICWNRENFIKGINFLVDNKYYFPKELLQKLEKIKDEWYKARGLFIKSIFAKRISYVKHSSELIKDLSYMENDVLHILKSNIDLEDICTRCERSMTDPFETH